MTTATRTETALASGLQAPMAESDASAARLRLALAFAAVYIIWGSTYLAIRYVLVSFPPFLTAGARFLVAGSVLFCVGRARGGRATWAEWRTAAVLGFLMLLIGNGGVMWAEQRIPSGPTALIIATEPIMVVLLQRVVPSRRLILGLLLGLAGVAILVGPAALGGGEAIPPTRALVLVIGSTAWAWGSLLGRSGAMPKDGFLAAGMQMLCGGAFLAIAGLIHGDVAQLKVPTVEAVEGLLFLIIFGSIVAFTAYGYMVRHAAPNSVATYAFVNPVVAVILGSLIGKEAFTPRILVAAGTIVAGVVIITLQRPKKIATPSS